MSHRTDPEFWDHFDRLAPDVRELARQNFELLKQNPRHPSLRFKRVGDLWSVRVGLNHRALGADCEDGVSWFWIGTHDEYKRLIRG